MFLPGEFRDGEPGGLPSMGSHRVGHDRRDLAAAAATVLKCPCSLSLVELPFAKYRIL